MVFGVLLKRWLTTLPRAVRTALDLAPGDRLQYIITGKRVVLQRSAAGIAMDPFSTFTEWHSDADRQAYGDL
jgi:antitoxin PrlF